MKTKKYNNVSDENNIQNSYCHMDILDLRHIIQTPEACKNIKQIKHVSTVILPKERDAATMSSISEIKMSHVEEVLFLADNEAVVPVDGLQIKNAVSAHIFDRDFTTATAIHCKNCAVLILHAISNTEFELPSVLLKNIACLLIDNSLKKVSSNFDMKNIATTHYDNIPEDAQLLDFKSKSTEITKTLLNNLKSNSILNISSPKVKFAHDVTVQDIKNKSLILIINANKVIIGDDLKNYLLATSIINVNTFKRK